MRMQCGVLAPNAIQRGDFFDDIAGAIPVPDVDFVFFAVDIFFLLRVWLALAEFKAIVDAP